MSLDIRSQLVDVKIYRNGLSSVFNQWELSGKPLLSSSFTTLNNLVSDIEQGSLKVSAESPASVAVYQLRDAATSQQKLLNLLLKQPINLTLRSKYSSFASEYSGVLESFNSTYIFLKVSSEEDEQERLVTLPFHDQDSTLVLTSSTNPSIVSLKVNIASSQAQARVSANYISSSFRYEVSHHMTVSSDESSLAWRVNALIRNANSDPLIGVKFTLVNAPLNLTVVRHSFRSASPPQDEALHSSMAAEAGESVDREIEVHMTTDSVNTFPFTVVLYDNPSLTAQYQLFWSATSTSPHPHRIIRISLLDEPTVRDFLVGGRAYGYAMNSSTRSQAFLGSALVQDTFFRHNMVQLDFGEESNVRVQREVAGRTQNELNSTYARNHTITVKNMKQRDISLRVKELFDGPYFEVLNTEPELQITNPPLRLNPDHPLENNRGEFVVTVPKQSEQVFRFVVEYRI